MLRNRSFVGVDAIKHIMYYEFQNLPFMKMCAIRDKNSMYDFYYNALFG